MIAGEWYVGRDAADRAVAAPPLAGRVRIDDRYLPAEDVARYAYEPSIVLEGVLDIPD